jgi:hypothetical protein
VSVPTYRQRLQELAENARNSAPDGVCASTWGGNPVNDVVAVVGVGLLADFVCKQLFDKYEIIRQIDFMSDTPKAAKLFWYYTMIGVHLII